MYNLYQWILTNAMGDKLTARRQFKNRLKLIILLLASFSFSSHANQVTIPEVLNSQSDIFLPDFSYAGYNHGLDPLPVLNQNQINVIDYGAKANDQRDDSQALLRALAAAHEIQGDVVVKFPAGRFIVSEILPIKRSNIVLRGAGSGEQGTTLFFPRPLRIVDKGESLKKLNEYLKKYDKRQREKHNNIDEPFSEYSWSGGFIWVQKDDTQAAPYLKKYDPKISILAHALEGRAGTRRVKVKKATKLNVGDVIEIQWLNKKGQKGELINELYGPTDLEIGSHHWTQPTRPLVRQKTRITGIDGELIEISDPLLHTVSKGIPAQFAYWNHSTNVGIEDMHLAFPDAPSFGHHLEQGYNAIYFTGVYNGWIRNLTITNPDSGILTYNSANLTISNIQTKGNRRAHYAVHLGNVHNVLVRDLMIYNPVIHSLSVNTQSTKSVFLNAHVFDSPVLDQHAGANHQNLFDNVHFYIEALKDKKGRAYYPLWNGSGARYWQPGHGRYNTTWNLQVTVESGAELTESVILQGKAEGPDARIIGVHGNRKFSIDYRPKPHMERINMNMDDIPSLYLWQLRQRLSREK